MNSRFRLASVVALVFLATACASHAQTADSVATRGPLPGRGGIGGQMGGSYFIAEGPYSDGAQPRLSFIGHFRYVIGRHWGWQVSPYFTWTGYVSRVAAPYPDLNFPAEGTSKEFYITQIVGAAGQLQWITGGPPRRRPPGGGPPPYPGVVPKPRKGLKDPPTLELHPGTPPRGTAELRPGGGPKKSPPTPAPGPPAAPTGVA